MPTDRTRDDCLAKNLARSWPADDRLMLSITTVRSASGAAEYFAKDDYYTAEHSSESTLWSGQGAAGLDLSDEVDKADFEGVLNGVLPDSEKVGQVANRRAGMDLTFSVRKSVLITAYVAGDNRRS